MTLTRRAALVQPSRLVTMGPAAIVKPAATFKSRSYVTTSTGTSVGSASTRPHKPVTVFNDDGRVKWGDLSPMEKAARTTQQSLNFGIIIAGAAATVAVFVFMYTDVFSPSSTTAQFNRVVDRIRGDARVTAALGKGSDIRAFGEPTANKWTRNRPLASHTEVDGTGTEHMHMHFNLAGPDGHGVARVEFVRQSGEAWAYRSLIVETPKGNIVLEGKNGAAADAKGNKRLLWGLRLG